jgi:hypothetical protein
MTNNMFDLEQSIADWHRQMLAAGIKTPVPLEELEIHLREEIERQMESGLAPQKALVAAMGKIGQVQTLKAEFTKIGSAKKSNRLEQKVVFVLSLCVLCGMLTVAVCILHKYDMSRGWRLAGLANIGVVALAIVRCRQINALFPVIPDQRKRWIIGNSAAVTGAAGMVIFMNFILPRFSLTEGPLLVLVLWALTLMAAGGVVLAGLEEAAIKATTNN